jgi:hypothetical protein
MDRRRFVACLGIALSGCTSSSGPSGSELSLPEEKTNELRESVELNDVLVQTSRAHIADSVEYHDPSSAELRTWDPGSEKQIVVADYWAENLSQQAKDFPKWSNFHLKTPVETVEPVIETPTGVSVERIRATNDLGKPVWVESSGIRADYKQGWSGVFVAPNSPRESYAVEWVREGETVGYWRL